MKRVLLIVLLVGLAMGASYKMQINVSASPSIERIVGNQDFEKTLEIQVDYEKLVNGISVDCKHMSILLSNGNSSLKPPLEKERNQWVARIPASSFLDPKMFGYWNTTAICENESFPLGRLFFAKDEEGPSLVSSGKSVTNGKIPIEMKFWDPSGVAGIEISSNASVGYKFKGGETSNLMLWIKEKRSMEDAIKIRVWDILGNQKEYGKYVLVDLSPPQVHASILSNATSPWGPLVNKGFWLRMNISDETNSLCSIRVLGSELAKIDRNGEKEVWVNTSGLKPGNYSLVMNCTDELGNWKKEELPFTVGIKTSKEIEKNGTARVTFYGNGKTKRYVIVLPANVAFVWPSPDENSSNLVWYVYLGNSSTFTLRYKPKELSPTIYESQPKLGKLKIPEQSQTQKKTERVTGFLPAGFDRGALGMTAILMFLALVVILVGIKRAKP